MMLGPKKDIPKLTHHGICRGVSRRPMDCAFLPKEAGITLEQAHAFRRPQTEYCPGPAERQCPLPPQLHLLQPHTPHAKKYTHFSLCRRCPEQKRKPNIPGRDSLSILFNHRSFLKNRIRSPCLSGGFLERFGSLRLDLFFLLKETWAKGSLEKKVPLTWAEQRRCPA